MSHLKNNLVFSSLTILLVTGGSLGLAQSAHNKVSSQKLEAKNVNQVSNYSGDIDLLTVSQPTTPTTNNGQINSAFINRFNNAVILDSKTGQFSINQKTLPINATKLELTELDKLISQSNISLKQTILEVPKANVVQDGNSVVIGDSPKTAEQIAKGTSVQAVSLFHEGSNYVHSYWWGKRVGVLRTTVRKVSINITKGGQALGATLFFIPAPQVKAVGAAIGAASTILGYGMSYFPGGLVFNTTPNYLGSQVWDVQFQ
ncbi:hypothetical protein M5C73_05450 [Lactococcus lactis]|uniref:hypothetical protein n=1 Tax=Lactococcus lactis TaxID=1358 RepID=UPI002078CC61|nr:hypothetical protein [Lactococcus lactis]USI49137.1 hypothetical protein M5C73_05450 [Lactococcus lactis]